MINELIPVIEGCLKGSRVLEVTAYQGSDGNKRDEKLRLHGSNWYGELVAETEQWLSSLLKDKSHVDWDRLGGRGAEAVGAAQRALEGLRQKMKQAAPSKWQPACKGPAGEVLQELESKPGIIYLRNVSRANTARETPEGTPASRIQKIWPLAQYSVMLRLTPGSYSHIQQA